MQYYLPIRYGPILVLFVISLIVRAVAAHFAGMWVDPVAQMGMPAEEIVLAQSLAAGRGFVTPYGEPDGLFYAKNPSAHSPPGYPYLLAGMIALSSNVSVSPVVPYRCAVIVSVFISALVPVLIARIIAQTHGACGFWCGGVIAAFWPLLVKNSYLLWDTPFMLLGTCVAITLAVFDATTIKAASSVAVGLICGAFTLFNPLVGPFLGMAVLIRSLRIRPMRHAFGYGVWIAVAWLACLIPWTVRNYLEFGRLVPIRNNLGLELWLGNQPGADGRTHSTTRMHPSDNSRERRLVSELGDDIYMQAKQVESLAWIRKNPFQFAWLTSRRVVFFWCGNVYAPDPIVNIRIPGLGDLGVTRLAFGLIFLFTAYLGNRGWRSFPGKTMFWFGMIFLPLPYYVTHISPNYRVVVVPLMCVSTGLLLARVVLRVKGALCAMTRSLGVSSILWQKGQF